MHIRFRRVVITFGVVIAGATFQAAAATAFAPKLDVSVNAAKPLQTAKFIFAVTQPVTDPGSRHMLIAIPAGFTSSPAVNKLVTCDWPQEMIRACPKDSRIGSVEDRAVFPGGTVPLNGAMYWGGAISPGLYKLIVFLDDIGLDLHPQFEADLQARSGGGFDLTFDDLPQQPSSRFAITLDGGKRAVLITPAKCGDYRFDGSFISRGEERASSSATIPIRACFAPPLAVTDVGVNDASVARHHRAGVHFTVNRTTGVRVLVHNADGKKVFDHRVTVRRGQRSLSLGRNLHRGAYRIGLYFTTPDGGYFEQKVVLTVH